MEAVTDVGPEVAEVLEENLDKVLVDIRTKHEAALDPFERFKANFISENNQDGSDNQPEANLLLDFNSEIMAKVLRRFENSCTQEKMPVSILNEIFIGICPVIFNVNSDGPSHSPIHHAELTIPLFGKFSSLSSGTKQESKHKTASFVCGILHKLRIAFNRFKNKQVSSKKQTLIADSFNNLKNTSFDKKSKKRKSDNSNGNIDKQQPKASSTREERSLSPEDMSQEDYESTIPEEFILDPAKASAIYDSITHTIEKYLTPIMLERMFAHLDLHTQHQLNQQQLWRYQEIAGFVLEDTITGKFRTLTFATGTKCILGEYLSLEGDAVFDCHAEVLARRALKALFMEHISSILTNNLQDKPDFFLTATPTGFKLKEHLRIHLYISSPPCGDSRIFNFAEKKRVERNKLSRGLLRYKIEKGQGTIPTNIQYISCWDAFLASEDRIRIMSCSDKVSMWNFLGIQGSLLSNILEPIYIDSLVVTYLFRPQPLIRALYDRIPKDIQNPKVLPFRINCHKVARSHRDNSMKNTVFSAPPSVCHVWADFQCEENSIEIIKGDTGKLLLNSESSKYCKFNLSNRFLKLIFEYPTKIPATYFDSNELRDLYSRTDTNQFCRTYNYLKNLAQPYQQAKASFILGLHNSQLGDWCKFSCDANLFQIC